jgi:hypothetical protein
VPQNDCVVAVEPACPVRLIRLREDRGARGRLTLDVLGDEELGRSTLSVLGPEQKNERADHQREPTQPNEH